MFPFKYPFKKCQIALQLQIQSQPLEKKGDSIHRTQLNHTWPLFQPGFTYFCDSYSNTSNNKDVTHRIKYVSSGSNTFVSIQDLIGAQIYSVATEFY